MSRAAAFGAGWAEGRIAVTLVVSAGMVEMVRVLLCGLSLLPWFAVWEQVCVCCAAQAVRCCEQFLGCVVHPES